jgi:hypothetical protein
VENGHATHGRRYYRIVETNPPLLWDFLSNEARGIVPRRPLSRRDADRWRGVSHYVTRTAAFAKTDDSPWLGDYVAVVELPSNSAARVEQTGRDLHHVTIWAEADDLLSWVISVEARPSL